MSTYAVQKICDGNAACDSIYRVDIKLNKKDIWIYSTRQRFLHANVITNNGEDIQDYETESELEKQYPKLMVIVRYIIFNKGDN